MKCKHFWKILQPLLNPQCSGNHTELGGSGHEITGRSEVTVC
jgi:hypothetical protein